MKRLGVFCQRSGDGRGGSQTAAADLGPHCGDVGASAVEETSELFTQLSGRVIRWLDRAERRDDRGERIFLPIYRDGGIGTEYLSITRRRGEEAPSLRRTRTTRSGSWSCGDG